MPQHHLSRYHGRYAAVGLLLLVCLLTALLTVGLLPSAPAAAQGPSLPVTPPDGEVGLALYYDRCANCHGPEGNGDGELSTNLPMPPRQFTDPDYYRTAVPAVMYDVISNGRLEQGMPPFGAASSNPIPEPNRWDLTAAVYSLATPAEDIATGETLYVANCLACHGETGLGDGPQGADVETDLSSPIYWFDKSNETVFMALASGAIEAHDYELSEEERWQTVDYTRSLSYLYVNTGAPAEPIELATISGFIENGTTGGPVDGGQQALLRAFTPDFQETLSLTTTVAADGSYSFAVNDVPPDWIFIVTSEFEGLNFSSAADQVDRTSAELELPITVFEQTADPAAVRIEQVHTILDFFDDQLQVSSLFVVSNEADAVFMGANGSAEAGTVRFNVPENAQNLNFERAFGNATNFLPATEMIQTEDGWADTLPLRPGAGTLSLLVSYTLPYEDGMLVSYPLPYATNGASLIMPEAGVTVVGEGWVSQGTAQTPSGPFVRYATVNSPLAGELTFTLNGRPERTTTTGGAAVAPRNETNELIIGGIGLLMVIVAGVFAVRAWRQRDAYDDFEEEEWDDDDTAVAREAGMDARQALLLALAELDDAYEQGDLAEAAYQERRSALLADLVAIWDAEGEDA